MRNLAADPDKYIGDDQAERERVLVRVLAEAQVSLRLEQVYTVIFGSQIALLRTLHQSGSLPKSEAEKFFERAKSFWPQIHKDATFEAWLQYLINVEFVAVEGNTIKTTGLASHFINYITSRQLVMEAKPG
jgi:hypothetical protein